MISEYFLMKLDQDRREASIKRGAYERMLRSIEGSKPGFKCKVCEKLAALLLKASQRLQQAAQVRPADDLPAVGTEKLRRALEESRTAGIFI